MMVAAAWVCDLCGAAAAAAATAAAAAAAAAEVYCDADGAFLCWSCDAAVHGANFLVARHVRRLACTACRAADSGRRFSGPGAPHPPPIRALCPSCRPADPPPPLPPPPPPPPTAPPTNTTATASATATSSALASASASATSSSPAPAAKSASRIAAALDEALLCAAKLSSGTCEKGIVCARARLGAAKAEE